MFFDVNAMNEYSASGPNNRHAKLIFDQRTIKGAPISMALFRFEPGQTGPAHHHDTEVEVYYGMQGAGSVILDEVEHRLAPHSALYIPPGKTHETRNSGSEDFVFLAVFGPALDLDFIRNWNT